MISKKCFPTGIYFRKFLNTFLPRIFFNLSPRRFFAQRHWKEQNSGDIHGFDNYLHDHPRIPHLIAEIQSRIRGDETILDVGCNCGYYLSRIKKAGFNHLSGVDIASAAIQYGKDHLDLDGVDLSVGSFEEILPRYNADGKSFDLVYSMGATIELVHPAFDIIGNICRISDHYVILIISEWGHEFPRFWEYEFNKNGFLLIKKIYPYDGVNHNCDPLLTDSLLVFERQCPK
jgi:SAM-dependent methyltransferase